MSVIAAGAPPFRLPVRRLFWLPIVVSGVLVVLVLGGLVAISWHGLARIEPIQIHSVHIGRLRSIGLDMERVLFRGLRGPNHVTPDELVPLGTEVQRLVADEPDMSSDERTRLGNVAKLLVTGTEKPTDRLYAALAELRSVQDQERRRHNILLKSVADDMESELELSLVLVVVLPLAGLVALLILRRRIATPLNSLGDLLVQLAGRDYRPVPETAVDETAALVQPVFHSYNALVERLRRLEGEHRDREQTLEQEVRGATEALLKQSRQLARSDRLAAVGAVSAGLAHELRNPLAGIQMACSKLRRVVPDGEQSDRLDAVIAELKRLNRLLTERVDAARHAPEPLTQARIKDVVEQFLSLVRYQVPEGVSLVSDITDDIVCLVPEGGLRQALLNLVLNASQSMENTEGVVEICARREGENVVLSVSDNGPGFQEEMLAVGVRPFASGRAGGTGLGLAMVRRFAQDMNGELHLANLEPHGARVTLRLPCPNIQPEDLAESPVNA
jgi:two-component system NtrC family sensor kinase